MKGAWKNTIHTAKRWFLDILLPQSCAGCQKENESFCPACQTRFYKNGAQCLICGFRNQDGRFCAACRPAGANLKSALWAGRYDGALRDAVRELKYGRRKTLAEALAKMLFKKFSEIFPNFKNEEFAAVPIPLHKNKLRERGFNQAELLAREFSKLAHIPLFTSSLFKIKDTSAQVNLVNREERIKNLEGAFSAKLPPLTPTIILIDDVSTTGATMAHAARALAKAGAKNIIALAVAHG